MKKIIGIIPARMASSRFPGKPLSPILGMPMIGHVYLRSKMSKTLNDVYVATCDIEIKEYVESISGKTIMTLTTHERASDRTAEAMLKVENETGTKVDIVVMIQGDEPMLYPEMVDVAVEPILNDSSVGVVNLMAKIKTEEERNDPNEVKVVIDKNNDAVYFSREPIPSVKKASSRFNTYKQICIIPFTKESLALFNKLTPTPLEQIESVDMLRYIEHGYKVRMVYSKYDTYSVDTPEDLEYVEGIMKSDSLVKSYLKPSRR